jgi:hypothetical protein
MERSVDDRLHPSHLSTDEILAATQPWTAVAAATADTTPDNEQAIRLPASSLPDDPAIPTNVSSGPA